MIIPMMNNVSTKVIIARMNARITEGSELEFSASDSLALLRQKIALRNQGYFMQYLASKNDCETVQEGISLYTRIKSP